MKLLICTCFMSSMAFITNAIQVSEDPYIFLALSETYELPPPCPPNEFYKQCMRNCSDCSRRGICNVENCIEGCDCAPHFYRVLPGGPCEPVGNCPKSECEENEVFRECGPMCERCTTFKCRIINCDHKCYCKQGYLRNKGICIPEEECPKKKRCYRTEKWAESGPVDEFCLHGQNNTSNNETQEVPQCYCREGYKRNALGYCIAEENCHLIKCPGIEVYHDCVPKCNATCRNYGDLNCTEDDNCYAGCFCPPGYAMNDFRVCVPVEECSLDIEHMLVAVPEEEDSAQVQTTACGLDRNTKSKESRNLDENSGEDFQREESNSTTQAAQNVELDFTTQAVRTAQNEKFDSPTQNVELDFTTQAVTTAQNEKFDSPTPNVKLDFTTQAITAAQNEKFDSTTQNVELDFTTQAVTTAQNEKFDSPTQNVELDFTTQAITAAQNEKFDSTTQNVELDFTTQAVTTAQNEKFGFITQSVTTVYSKAFDSSTQEVTKTRNTAFDSSTQEVAKTHSTASDSTTLEVTIAYSEAYDSSTQEVITHSTSFDSTILEVTTDHSNVETATSRITTTPTFSSRMNVSEKEFENQDKREVSKNISSKQDITVTTKSPKTQVVKFDDAENSGKEVI